MTKQHILGLFLLLGLLSAASSVRALPEYPKQLQAAADAPCLPHCNVCHRDDNAGSGTVDRPFALSLKTVGGLGRRAGVATAVDRLRAAQTDTDGDGISDIDELQQGDDPNYAGNGSICGPEVGCSATTPRSYAQLPWWSAFLGLLLAVHVWRRLQRVAPQ